MSLSEGASGWCQAFWPLRQVEWVPLECHEWNLLILLGYCVQPQGLFPNPFALHFTVGV